MWDFGMKTVHTVGELEGSDNDADFSTWSKKRCRVLLSVVIAFMIICMASMK